jgi:hypothetical protein
MGLARAQRQRESSSVTELQRGRELRMEKVGAVFAPLRCCSGVGKAQEWVKEQGEDHHVWLIATLERYMSEIGPGDG